MKKYNLEDVYTTNGTPTVTYVKPQEYLKLVVALRTKGKCVVIEGPSGIGKTTAVNRVISELKLEDKCLRLTARKENDRPVIKEVSKGNFKGIVIIDDFHRLEASVQSGISDVMKYLADESDDARKIIVIGINRVGDTLVHFSPDLNNRISTIHFEMNSRDKIEELVSLGESALNIKFDDVDAVARSCYGSFHIAQLMCYTACIQSGIIETCDELTEVHFSYPSVSGELYDEFARSYFETARRFATGNKLRRAGRAPYLHVLKWLSESDTWTISLTTEIQKHPEQKAGVTQIVEKGFLADFLQKNPEIGKYIHFDSTSRILSAEDPKFVFYIKAINWNNFARDIGYAHLVANTTYDFAFSFAGADRDLVEAVFDELQVLEIAVFYDKNEQVDILAAEVEEYLYPIYNSKAAFVVPFMSRSYPHRVWTKMESKAFQSRFGQNAVIPVWFSDVEDSMFDESKKYGGISYDVKDSRENQAKIIAMMLARKIEKAREEQNNLVASR